MSAQNFYCTLCCRIGDFRYFDGGAGTWMHTLNGGGSVACLAQRAAPANFGNPLDAGAVQKHPAGIGHAG